MSDKENGQSIEIDGYTVTSQVATDRPDTTIFTIESGSDTKEFPAWFQKMVLESDILRIVYADKIKNGGWDTKDNQK